jgi:hypothetical protein
MKLSDTSVMMLKHASEDVYVPQATFKFWNRHGWLDLERMMWAWQCVYAKNSSLRLSYREKAPGVWESVTHLDLPNPVLGLHKVASLQADHKDVKKVLLQERRLASQASNFPLFRMAVLHTQPDPQRMVGELLGVITCEPKTKKKKEKKKKKRKESKNKRKKQ